MNPSTIRFLVDVGVGKKVEEWLQKAGYDVKAVRDIDPNLDDRIILDLAVAEDRMIITMDKDFGELVYKSKRSHAGVFLLRLEDATSQEKVRTVSILMSLHADRIAGKFCVFQNNRLRIRK